MNLIRWEPFRETWGLRRALDTIFEDTAIPAAWQPEGLRKLVPPVDIMERENEVEIKAVVPGVAGEDLNIEIAGDTLTIKGESKSEKEDKKENYFYREWQHGTFLRSLTLPAGLETAKAEAELENGVLTLTIPKSVEAKPKTVKVRAKKSEKTAKEAEKAGEAEKIGK